MPLATSSSGSAATYSYMARHSVPSCGATTSAGVPKAARAMLSRMRPSVLPWNFSRGSSSAGSAVGVPLPSTAPRAAAKALECAEASDDPEPWTSVPSTSKVISVTGRGATTPAATVESIAAEIAPRILGRELANTALRCTVSRQRRCRRSDDSLASSASPPAPSRVRPPVRAASGRHASGLASLAA